MAECLCLLLAKAPENRPRDGIEAAQLLNAVSGQVRDVESLLTEAFHGSENISWMRADDRFRLKLVFPDGRQQVLFVEPSDHGIAERLLLIYSVCCPAQSEYYEQALRLNAEIPHGGLSLREIIPFEIGNQGLLNGLKNPSLCHIVPAGQIESIPHRLNRIPHKDCLKPQDLFSQAY